MWRRIRRRARWQRFANGKLGHWRERLREEATSGDGPMASAGMERPHLIPVELAGSESQPASGAALTLVFGDGVRLEITPGCDPGLLGQTFSEEWGVLWVMMAVAVANIVLAIWRPRFSRRHREARAQAKRTS